jgi:type I site-specific restriction endonuclease
MLNEADTCRKFVVPKLQAAGWDTDPHSIAEQRTFTEPIVFATRFMNANEWHTVAKIDLDSRESLQ